APAPAPQTPAPPPAKPATAPQGTTPAPTPAPQPPAAAPPPPVEIYTYRAEGRRDPFQTLIGGAAVSTSRRGEGPSGMTLAEISVRGIMQSRGSLVAMV